MGAVVLRNQMMRLNTNSVACWNLLRRGNPSSISSAVDYRHISQHVKSNGSRAFLVDTLALVRRLEAQGIPSVQAEAITAAITEVLNDSLENVAQSFVSKGEMQKIEMLQESNISKFKAQVQSSQIAHADISQLSKTIDSGFVPVLHGDAVFDDLQGCTILSGDVIIRHLAQLLRPKYVVFLTDVLGVYDRPPQDSNAVLLREIAVGEDGSWSIVKPILETNKVEITVASHDTTGGMATKISEAAMIAKLGIDVYIVMAGTSHSLRALTGEITRSIPDDWRGTVIRFSKQTNAND